MVWEFGPAKFPPGVEKIQLFHKMDFWVRYRKYGLKVFRDYVKKFVEVLPELATRPRKHNFLNFWSTLGPNFFWEHKLHIDINAYAESQSLGVYR